MTQEQAETVITFARHDMNVTDTARVMYLHRNTLVYRLDKITSDTGLNPRRFFDLVRLLMLTHEENNYGY